jgi:hypothetical protein
MFIQAAEVMVFLTGADNGFLGTVYSYSRPVEFVRLQAEFESSLGEPEYSEERVIKPWWFRSA